MPEYDNTNTGALFRNDKDGNEKRPDYKGSLDVNGEQFWISAWIRESKNDGRKFMSLKIEPKEQRQQQQPAKRQEPRNLSIPSNRQDAHNAAKANGYAPQQDDSEYEIGRAHV